MMKEDAVTLVGSFEKRSVRIGWKAKKRTGAATWEYTAPVHIRGYCPHPSNHLRRRIHQPSLLPRNIHRNACAMQAVIFLTPRNAGFSADSAPGPLRKPFPATCKAGGKV